MLMSISTGVVLCRLQGILFKFKTVVKLEVCAIAIPIIFALVFKRFNFITCVALIIVRGLFILLLKYDMKTFLYPHKRIKMIDEED